MQYTSHYASPLGAILLAAEDEYLTGLWFEGQKYFARTLDKESQEREISVLSEAKAWLDVYFAGREPSFKVPLKPRGTAFQLAVWEILSTIPYGKTMTYGEIASQLAKKQGRERGSSQAVGGAVGHNEISIIIPCHRVIGADGSLTGYAGGLDKKVKLLALEGVDVTGLA